MKQTFVLFPILLLCSFSCTPYSPASMDVGVSDNQAQGVIGGAERIIVIDAPKEQCSSGGKIYIVYIDTNNNHIQDIAEQPISSQLVCNSQNTPNTDPSLYSTVNVIYPCNNTASSREALLLLENGQVLASYSDNMSGLNTRLVLIPDGNYLTTDGTACAFTLITHGLERSILWNGQTQMTWSIH